MQKIRVILVTDGDQAAQQVVESVAYSLGRRCISASGGNPTPISGPEIVALLQEVPYDPVLVLFDDKGHKDLGCGEQALKYVALHPAIEVLGALAVASNAGGTGVLTDFCITRRGKIISGPVNKFGKPTVAPLGLPLVFGDTVDVLNELKIPLIVGIGDIGKMDYADHV
ncbi:MAG: stage V sporulation protein AE, partial [Sporomusaceae bacterium]|nr:stage V sporulation protein AE [Sporomusaceae bacterium]